MVSASSLIPMDFILQSYNAYNPKIAEAPNQILNYLSNYLVTPLNEKQINQQTISQQFDSSCNTQSTFEETQTEFAASVGISGSYGFYSGSMQANYSKQTCQSSTTFNFGFNASVDCGTCSFFQPSSMSAIRACLQPTLLDELNSISTIQQAQEFTSTYGTHLILGVSLGGSLYVSVYATTSSLATQTSVGVSVEASYKAVSSMSATASTTYSLSTQYQSEGFSYLLNTIGGSSAAAANMDVTKPETYSAWAQTCTVDTVCGVSNSLELWQLATNTTAQNQLKLYLQLVAVQQSIQYPSYFSNAIALQPFQENKVVVTASSGFKIIGGGATVNMNSSNFLTGSYPSVDQNLKITGWTAASHDLSTASNSTTDVLSVYAIGIYDPTNLLSVSCVTAIGSNPGVGSDSATATLPTNYILAGGGVHGDWQGGGIKFMMQSFPDSSVSNSWTGMLHDYHTPASNVPLTVYAIGVYSEYFTITSQITNESINNVQHGNAVATAVRALAGGGVQVTSLSGAGNLVQQTYPSTSTTWTEYNKDTDGNVSPSNSVAYVIQLTCAS
ncbi:MAG: MAC/perforin domain-containing protein [Pseudomonadota bacterium]